MTIHLTFIRKMTPYDRLIIRYVIRDFIHIMILNLIKNKIHLLIKFADYVKDRAFPASRFTFFASRNININIKKEV